MLIPLFKRNDRKGAVILFVELLRICIYGVTVVSHESCWFIMELAKIVLRTNHEKFWFYNTIKINIHYAEHYKTIKCQSSPVLILIPNKAQDLQ